MDARWHIMISIGNNIEKHCGFQFAYQHMPMTPSISQCVVSWARWGPLGRI